MSNITDTLIEPKSAVIKSSLLDRDNITGSEAVLEALIAEGVKTIFGYPGGAITVSYTHLTLPTNREV